MTENEYLKSIDNERELLIARIAELEDALKDMVNQFAMDCTKTTVDYKGRVWSGGYSSIENAFKVLGLKEPCKRKDLE